MGSAAVAVSLISHPGLWAEWGPKAGLGEVRGHPGCAYPVSTSGGVGGPGDISGAGGQIRPWAASLNVLGEVGAGGWGGKGALLLQAHGKGMGASPVCLLGLLGHLAQHPGGWSLPAAV